jgi:hypothetical protein
MPSMRARGPVVPSAVLNRATLARQRLLEREPSPVVPAIEALGGLQAQEPASPAIALWTRLDGFAAADLHEAIEARRVVKATLMRTTLHLVSAADYLRLLPALRPMHHALRRRGATIDDDIVRRLGRSALRFASEPRTNGELRAHVDAEAERVAVDLDEAWWWVRLRHDFIHTPTGAPWSYGRRPSLSAASAWLPDGAFGHESEAITHLVRRYLAAFGPATAADASAWAGLPVARLRPGIAALEEAAVLWHGRDELGRPLLDLVDAPRPDGDVPAPPRLLPMWDSVLLAFADRTRIISDEARAIVVARNGDTLPSFLVDGQVAGLWWPVAERGERARIELEPFGRLGARERRQLEDEAERLAAFVADREPLVYARYRRSRARRQPSGRVSSTARSPVRSP